MFLILRSQEEAVLCLFYDSWRFFRLLKTIKKQTGHKPCLLSSRVPEEEQDYWCGSRCLRLLDTDQGQLVWGGGVVLGRTLGRWAPSETSQLVSLQGEKTWAGRGLPKLQLWSFRKVLQPHVYPFVESQHGPNGALFRMHAVGVKCWRYGGMGRCASVTPEHQNPPISSCKGRVFYGSREYVISKQLQTMQHD